MNMNYSALILIIISEEFGVDLVTKIDDKSLIIIIPVSVLSKYHGTFLIKFSSLTILALINMILYMFIKK